MKRRLIGIAILVGAMVVGAGAGEAANVTPPDLAACQDASCENLPKGPICDDAGFQIRLKDYTPAAPSNSGTATYVYEICSPAAGTCVGGNFAGDSCLENTSCQKSKGQLPAVPTAECNRTCAVDDFHDLSHFNVAFPALGGVDSCLPTGTQITGECSQGSFVIGDGSCGQTNVAKCDSPNLATGTCMTMTVNIPGETNGIGLGAAIVVSKESTECNASCIAGPSCDRCDEPTSEEDACLTRTAGFWGTHAGTRPNGALGVTDQVLETAGSITVCGKPLDTVAVDGTSNDCKSTSEALCVAPGNESKSNPSYASLVRALAAAKLNLAATAALPGGNCSGYTYDLDGSGPQPAMHISDIIAYCEGLCGANNGKISNSSCIEALNGFNQSDDTYPTLPALFATPGPATPAYCQAANGDGKVIGRGSCN